MDNWYLEYLYLSSAIEDVIDMIEESEYFADEIDGERIIKRLREGLSMTPPI